MRSARKKLLLYITTALFLHALFLCTKPMLAQSIFRADNNHFGIPTMQLGIDYKIIIEKLLEEIEVDYNNAMLLEVYMASYNDLRQFAIENLKQMAQIGSGKRLILVAHLDIRIPPNKKKTLWYLILPHKLVHLNASIPDTQILDSGLPQTLLKFTEFCARHFPAKHIALELWNHGSGAIDPYTGRVVQADELFVFNPKTNLLELDRSENFLDKMNMKEDTLKGICWSDDTGNYLSNHDLLYCLKTITTDIYNGKKLDWIGCDACLMQMLEVGSILKDYAEIMVGSQEVILGPGWHYQSVLAPFTKKSLTPFEFAKHVVSAYKLTYDRITQDYTLSAVDLSWLAIIEDEVDQLAKSLIELLKNDKGNTIRNAIYKAKSKHHCTHFDERSYKDLDHLIGNIACELEKISPTTDQQKQQIEIALASIVNARHAIQNAVFSNVVGKRLSRARGLSIYFPERKIHSSYSKSPFGKTNSWSNFLRYYLTT